ncbi:MAG: hypothetical protein WBB67_12100 [bacterium]
MKIRVISQNKLSAECWQVQIWGREACKDCNYRHTKKCGGKQIINTGKNVLGHRIPLPDVSFRNRRQNEV